MQHTLRRTTLFILLTVSLLGISLPYASFSQERKQQGMTRAQEQALHKARLKMNDLVQKLRGKLKGQQRESFDKGQKAFEDLLAASPDRRQSLLWPRIQYLGNLYAAYFRQGQAIPIVLFVTKPRPDNDITQEQATLGATSNAILNVYVLSNLYTATWPHPTVTVSDTTLATNGVFVRAVPTNPSLFKYTVTVRTISASTTLTITATDGAGHTVQQTIALVPSGNYSLPATTP